MDSPDVPPTPTHDPQVHHLPTVLTVVLARIQLARRHYRRGNHETVDQHMAQAEAHIKHFIARTDDRRRETTDAPNPKAEGVESD